MISNRLIKVKNFINEANTVVDVGTDHGYVPIFLIKEKRAKKVIAADINQGPLKMAKVNIERYELDDKIELRLGSGLVPISENEADVVVIAGMGGVLISEILEESINVARTVQTFVIQGMNALDYLRKYLFNNNFKIEKESLVKEKDKIYTIMVVKNGEDNPYEKEVYYHIGKNYVDTEKEIIVEYIEKKLAHFKRVRDNLASANKYVKAELDYFSNIYEELLEIKRGVYND